jgi:dTDP-3-amino-3,4,6-trideoxy-alpha-D-glucose transaminase
MVPVHLFGHAIDLDELERLRDDFEMLIVEDCAQSVGARSESRPTGSVGQAAATSFYPTKNLGCLGDGGALLTDDAGIAERAAALRHYGQSATYVHDHLGLNSRLDEVQAAFLADVMLPRLVEWTNRRVEIATRYRSEITNPELTIPAPPKHSISVWHLFPVLTPPGSRASFRAALDSSGIQTGIHYPVLIQDQRALAPCRDAQIDGDLETARYFADNEVSLPIHPFLTDKAVDAVITACDRWRP